MKSRFSRFNAPAKPTASQGNPPMQDDPIKMVYPSQEDQNRLAKVEGNLTVAELLSQLNEALKREETANTRLKEQETQHSKQVQELRQQVRKSTIDILKIPKAPSSSSGFSTKLDKKKDKSREYRDLQKTIKRLKEENQELERKMNKLSQFIEFAANLKERAALQCLEKDQMIFSLRKESVIATQVKVEEINKRYQLESELDALRKYIDYIQHKKREGLRNKAIQTETTIPMRINYDSTKFLNPFVKESALKPKNLNSKQKAFSNYRALESAVSLLQTKGMEEEFQKQTNLMEKRFYAAVTPDQESNRIYSVKTADSLVEGRRPLHLIPQFSLGDL